MVMTDVYPICEMFLLGTTAFASVLRKVLRGRPVVPPAKAKVVVSVAKAAKPDCNDPRNWAPRPKY
jgi:hypothetical protein